MRPILLAAACAASVAAASEGGAPPGPERAFPGEFRAEPPPLSPETWPCSTCHDKPGDPTRRELAFHDEVKLRHDAEHRWCLDCHSNEDRDVLHLSSGETVPFAESHRLCGQCHGDKYRDWRVGVHGKRVGAWDGAKTYFLCVSCHDPHAPRFKPLRPEPRPLRPEEMRR